MAKKLSASSVRESRAAKNAKHTKNEDIDFSDIPEFTDEELRLARRVGRPSTGNAKQLTPSERENCPSFTPVAGLGVNLSKSLKSPKTRLRIFRGVTGFVIYEVLIDFLRVSNCETYTQQIYSSRFIGLSVFHHNLKHGITFDVRDL